MADETKTKIDDYPLLLTTDDVAELLDMRPKRVSELCAAKKIPGHKLGGRWRIPRDAFWSLFDDSAA